MTEHDEHRCLLAMQDEDGAPVKRGGLSQQEKRKKKLKKKRLDSEKRDKSVQNW